MVFLDCRKSGFAAFSRKLRYVLRLSCPLIADNSTLTPRKVFSATHMSRQKTNCIAFASADAKLCEAFFDKLKKLLHLSMQKLFQPVKEVSPSCKLFDIMEKKRTGGKKNGTVATG